jgi:hypothetical protein
LTDGKCEGVEKCNTDIVVIRTNVIVDDAEKRCCECKSSHATAQVSKFMVKGAKLLIAEIERPEASNVPRKKGPRKYPLGRSL